MGKQVVNEQMYQAEDTDVFPAPRVDRDGGFQAELEVFPEPDEPRIDRPGSLAATATIQTGFERQLDQGDHAIERGAQPYILDEGLQVLQVVLQGEPPAERDRVALDILRDLPAAGIHSQRHRLSPGGDMRRQDARERQGPEVGQRRWQISEPLAKEETGGEGR